MVRGSLSAAGGRRPSIDPLGSLGSSIRACRICVDTPTGKPLGFEPRPVVQLSDSARICICGQAPGTRVHASGILFDDPSGERLRAWMGIDREVFYDADRVAIVPMGFCFPGLDQRGSDLPPRRECAPQWHRRVFAAMGQLELIIAVGAYAHAYHLGDLKHKRLTDTVADWRAIRDHRARPYVIPTPHPSWRNTGWLKANPWFEAELLPVLRRDVKRLI
jgi:uracil-DNA glycosylase